MRIALVQQHATADKADNICRGLRLQDSVLVTDIDLGAVRSSHADRLFLQHRRPELYAQWFNAS